jgi:xylulokinase
MLWSDHRSSEQCKWILQQVPDIEKITQNEVLPAFTLPKLIWVRDHALSIYQRINRILVPKDYIRHRLTGKFITEPSDASGTSMYDSGKWAWSDQILSALDIPLKWLPNCVPSTEITGQLTRSAANDLGLTPGIPVIGGGADQAAQAIAMGAIKPGILGLSMGTSGVIVMTHTSPVKGSFCHAVDQRWLQLNSMHSAGLSLEWYRESFYPGVSYNELETIAQRAPAGSQNLVFMPFLLGERQSASSSVPASFLGMTPQHDPGHFIRAIYEGVAFEFRRMIDYWLRPGMQVEDVRFSGGGSKSYLWQVILANLLDLPVKTAELGASFGAALLAGVGIGWWESIEQAVESSILLSMIENPASSLTQVYEEHYFRYLHFYEMLSG